jgi:hypothetical protein
MRRRHSNCRRTSSRRGRRDGSIRDNWALEMIEPQVGLQIAILHFDCPPAARDPQQGPQQVVGGRSLR